MEEFWPEPESFLPERWDAPSDRPANTYMPFSIGPRNCIGQQFAMIEGKIMLAQLIHNFDIELQLEDNGTSMSLLYSI
jgi:cytochrome P450